MRKAVAALEGVSAIILDMDGVLYRGDRPVEGASKAVNWFRRSGRRVIFTTNNSAHTRAAYAQKLARMRIPASESEVITSGQVTAIYLKERCPRAKIYAVGEDGLSSELKEVGLELLSQEETEKATHVVVGLDRTIDYCKIAAGLRALLAGAEFIATNADASYPTETGLSPGAGAMIGALAGCSGRRPSLVIGKPAPYMVKVALRLLGAKASETAMIGDRLDTDITVGKRMGLRTILVLSGACTEEDLSEPKIAPDFVFKNIAEMVVD